MNRGNQRRAYQSLKMEGGAVSERFSRKNSLPPEHMPDLSAWSARHTPVNVGRGVFADLKHVSIRVNKRLFFETLPTPGGHINFCFRA